ncbi:hypothetical protein FQN54_000450 [Arachnomyces sp. PD_36]|nr:hypothetical protein FQN54_000450 [Arachnomyces sp. PD_36]
MSSTPDLPSTPREWQNLVGKKRLIGSTIHTARLSSASTIEEDQYLLFRVLWRIHPIEQFDLKRLDLAAWETKANEHLANYSSWKTYCDGLVDRTVYESTFALAHYFQLQAADTEDETSAPNVVVTPIASRTRSKIAAAGRQLARTHLQTPTKSTGALPDDSESESESELELEDEEEGDLTDIESPLVSRSPAPEEIRHLLFQQTKDEQIVNTALVNFLSALTLHAGLANHWTLHRKSFKANFTNASFEARTDGYLEDEKPGGRVRALVEVKAALRIKKRKPICMQEAAQMVAWIRSHPDRGGWLNLPGRRIHVSQDHHQIYIVIAEFTDGYIDYLEKGAPSDVYMTMHEYGPWETDSVRHMKNVATILVAFVLRAAADREAEEARSKQSTA